MATILDFDIPNNDREDESASNFYPTPPTNAGESAFDVHEETSSFGINISVHVILNQCGTCLALKKHQIKFISNTKFFLQILCATSIGTSIAIFIRKKLFPHIFIGKQQTQEVDLGRHYCPPPEIINRISFWTNSTTNKVNYYIIISCKLYISKVISIYLWYFEKYLNKKPRHMDCD